MYKFYINFETLKLTFCECLTFDFQESKELNLEYLSKEISFVIEKEFEIKKEKFYFLRLKESVNSFKKDTVLCLFFPKKRPYLFDGVCKNDFAEIVNPNPFNDFAEIVNKHLKKLLEFDYNNVLNTPIYL